MSPRRRACARRPSLTSSTTERIRRSAKRQKRRCGRSSICSATAPTPLRRICAPPSRGRCSASIFLPISTPSNGRCALIFGGTHRRRARRGRKYRAFAVRSRARQHGGRHRHIFLTREQFFALGESNFIPILSVDCRIDDALFFEIAPDYAALRAQADAHFQAPYRYVCIPPRDETLKREIEGAFENVTFVRGLSDLASIPEGNCFITQTVLIEALSGRKDVFCPDGLERRTAERAAACIRLALSHEPCKQHIFRVS